MKRKLIQVTSALAIMAAVLTGCGGSSAGDIPSRDGKPVLNVTIAKMGYGTDWLKNICKAYNEKTGVGFSFNILVGQKGVSTISTQLESYKLNADLVFTKQGTFEKDIYFTQGAKIGGKVVDCMYADLTDVYNTKYSGEGKTIKEKMLPEYEKQYNFSDKYYGMPWAGGMMGIVRNLSVWQQYGLTDEDVPLTTDELFELCDLVKNDEDKTRTHNPFIYSVSDEYYTAVINVFTAQYEGRDAMNNNFLKGKDPDGKYSSAFYTYDGQEVALRVMKNLVDNYQQKNPRSYDFTQMQQQFLLNKAMFCVNGSWLENEMTTSSSYSEIDYIKFPVVSEIVKKTTFGKDADADEKLHTLIKYVDEHPQDGDVENKPSFASESDVQTVREARHYAYLSSGADHQALVPIWSEKIAEAKEFLKYLYSDNGLEIYYQTMGGGTLPFTATRELTGVTKITTFRKSVNAALAEGYMFAISSKARIFSLGKVSYYFANGCEGIISCFLSTDTTHTTVEYIITTNSNDLSTRWETIKNDCNGQFE